jgi:hypothetical protein
MKIKIIGLIESDPYCYAGSNRFVDEIESCIGVSVEEEGGQAMSINRCAPFSY